LKGTVPFFATAIAESLDKAGTPVGVPAYLLAGFVVGFQVSIGLLLTSVSSVTALAEERAGGSLDLLLVSPLPTRAIVWGKWCGTYLWLPWLALWPMVITMVVGMVCCWLEPQVLPVALVVGSTLAYGAPRSARVSDPAVLSARNSTPEKFVWGWPLRSGSRTSAGPWP